MAAVMNTPGAQLVESGESVGDALEEQERVGGNVNQAAPIREEEWGQWLIEIHDQPPFRRQQDRDCEYYDNNQLDADQLAEIERRGMLPVVENLIQPTMDVVLGLEAKMRTDWRVQGDTDEFQEVSEAFSQKLHETERESHADYALSDAYASQVKAGLGWVEVIRARDPFDYPYEVNSVHRREMYWDWNDRTRLLKDARYLMRRRWFDADIVAAYFPRYASGLKQVAGGAAVDTWIRADGETANRGFEMDWQGRMSVEEWEWRDTSMRRLALFQVYYRRAVRGHVFTMPDGRHVEFDPRNQWHMAAVASGRVKPRVAVFSKLRRAIYCGPFKLMDGDVEKRKTPFTPFWAYREDLTGVPYGLIRSMISPQDEVNARTQKMLWYLAAKRVTMDSDALDTQQNDVQEMLEEIARADSVVQLNPNRTNRDEKAFQVNDNLTLADAQWKVLQDKRETLQKVRGIFNAMLGSEDGAKSGIAINSLIEQSMTVLASIQSNYAFGRRVVGEDIVDLIRQDHIGRQVEVLVEGKGARKKTIILNQRVRDEQTGMIVLENDVERSRLKVALEDVPSTPAYRAQQMLIMSEIIKSAPPEIQAILYPVYLEGTEHPKRKELADQIRKMTGTQDPNDLPPEERAAVMQQQAETADMNKRMAMAQVAEQEAKAETAVAAAAKLRAEIQTLGQGMEGEQAAAIAEVQKMADEQIRAIEQKAALFEQAAKDRSTEITAKYNAEIKKAELAAAAEVETAKVNANSERVIVALAEKFEELKREIAEKDAQIVAEREEIMRKVREDQAGKQEQQLEKLMQKVADASEDSGEAMAEAVKMLGEQLKAANNDITQALKAITAAAPAVAATAPAAEDDGAVEIELETDKTGRAVGATVKKAGGTKRFKFKTDAKGNPIGATTK